MDPLRTRLLQFGELRLEAGFLVAAHLQPRSVTTRVRRIETREPRDQHRHIENTDDLFGRNQ